MELESESDKDPALDEICECLPESEPLNVDDASPARESHTEVPIIEDSKNDEEKVIDKSEHEMPPCDRDQESFDANEDPEVEASAANSAVAEFDAEENDEEDEDDAVNVIIKASSKGGIYKTGVAYQARSLTHIGQSQKTTRQGVELDDPGDIEGTPTLEFNLSSLGEEDKLWKRPGADITDYFNYGFTEETWVQYCEKQKILRQEYANSTLKPVLSGGGSLNLLGQRMRSGQNLGRTFDGSKQANINVINLSGIGATGLRSGMGGRSSASAVSSGSTVLNGSGVLAGHFSQPPPGYLSGSGGNAANNANVFTVPPPGFSNISATAAQLLTNAGANNAAVFPNLAMPPPVLGAVSGWAGGIAGLVAEGAEGLVAHGLLEHHSGRSPESVFSEDEYGTYRRSRRHHVEDAEYMERESYRPRRRSRSSSRDRRHSGRSHRHYDDLRSERDYSDRRERSSRHPHRSHERHAREEKYPGGVDLVLPPNFSTSRRSDRDRDYARFERSSRHGEHRDRDRSSRSSHHHSSSRHRRDSPRRSRSRDPGSPNGGSRDRSQSTSKQGDPLAAAAAAAANIAAALATSAE